MLSGRLAARCPPGLRMPLARYLAGEASGEITLMHFALQIGDPAALTATLEKLAAAAPQRGELAALHRLAQTNGDHLAQLGSLSKDGLVEIRPAGNDGIAAIRAQFDRAVAVAPEASVALYSLGSAEILDRATGEIVTRLVEWRLLRSDLAVLDIGCGIGRVERALAPHVGAITAIDLAPGMIAEARRRCRDLANVSFEQCSGHDLGALRGRSFGLILAIDSFPYLFAVDPAIVEQHMRDAAGLLQPGGTLVIMNFSYRGDDEADRRDVRRLAASNRLEIERAGTRDFTLWDGLTFLLSRPTRRG